MKIEDLRRLYPALSPEKLEEAGENLRQYLLLAWEIWEKEQATEQAAEQSTLTQKEADLRIKAKVDSPK